MSLRATRGIGTAALVLAAALSTGATAAHAASSPDTWRLHTVIGHLTPAPAAEGIQSVQDVSAANADGHLLVTEYADKNVWDLDVAGGTATPLLGSGFKDQYDDPQRHGALNESTSTVASVQDRHGITLAMSAVRVVATSATTQSAYGRTITAGMSVPVIGRGTSTDDGVLATDAAVTATITLAVSPTGLLGITQGPPSWTAPQVFTARVVPSTSGTYFGRDMQAGHIYTVRTGPSTRELAFDSRGDMITTEDDRVSITAVADGTAYGITMRAGQTYTLASGLDYPDHLHVDAQDNVFWENYDLSGDPVMMVPAADGKRFGTSITTGVPVQVTKVDNGFTLDSRGDVITSSSTHNYSTGTNRLQMWATAAESGEVFGKTVRAGQTTQVLDSTSAALFADGASAHRFMLNASRVDVRAGDLLATGATFNNDFADDAAVFSPKSDGSYFGRQMTAGHVYYVLSKGLELGEWSADKVVDGTPATSISLALDDAVQDLDGNIIASDNTQELVVVARQSGTFYGRQMTAGCVYHLTGSRGRVGGKMFDVESLGTGLVNGTQALAVDRQGNILVGGDQGLQVIPARTGNFYGRWMQRGKIYFLSQIGATNTPTGDGGPIRDAAHRTIRSIAVDGATGNVTVSESFSTGRGSFATVRVLANKTGTYLGTSMTKGHVYTVAGGPTAPTTGDDGRPATSAFLQGNSSAAATHDGRLLILGGSTLREVRTDGTIHTLAGQTKPGFSPDRAPATEARLIPESLIGRAIDIDVDHGDHPLMAGRDGIRTLR